MPAKAGVNIYAKPAPMQSPNQAVFRAGLRPFAALASFACGELVV